MAVDKNFVVKNGLEVNENLILADATAKKVGISSLNPRYTLDVAGGIGATDLYVVGVSTVLTEFNIGANGTTLTGIGGSIGIGTVTPAFLLDVRSPVSTGKTAIFARGDVYITGTLRSDDLTGNSANINALNVANTTTLGGSLSVTGLSTFSNSVTISGNVSASGISTFNNQVNITNNLQVSGVSTLSTLGVTGLTTTQNLRVTGVSTLSTLGVTGLTTSQNLRVTGVSTLGTVQISSGIVTATSGIVTYYGDGRFLNITNNASTGIGIGTTGGIVGYGITFLDLKGAGVSTAFYNSNVGIATIFFEGGGSGTIGIGTIFPTTFAGNGDLFYHIDYGRIFVYYDEVALGIGSTAVWVDAAPFNIGIVDIDELSLSKLTVTGPGGVLKSGIGNTALIVEGDARITGILTVGSSSLTLNGNTNQINGVTISSGIVTATTFNGQVNAGVATITTLSATNASFGGNVTIGGTLTYEDVTNIDSIGLVTARNGIVVTSGGINVNGGSVNINVGGLTVSGVSTFAGITTVTGTTLFAKQVNVSGVTTSNETRFLSVAEKLVRINGNTVSIGYTSSGANIGLCTNPSGDIVLNVTNIPTDSSFDNHTISFSVIVIQAGTARSCTSITLNGVSKSIKWVGGSFANAIAGVTTSSGYDIYNFVGINTIGSASTTANYDVLGTVNGGFR